MNEAHYFQGAPGDTAVCEITEQLRVMLALLGKIPLEDNALQQAQHVGAASITTSSKHFHVLEKHICIISSCGIIYMFIKSVCPFLILTRRQIKPTLEQISDEVQSMYHELHHVHRPA